MLWTWPWATKQRQVPPEGRRHDRPRGPDVAGGAGRGARPAAGLSPSPAHELGGRQIEAEHLACRLGCIRPPGRGTSGRPGRVPAGSFGHQPASPFPVVLVVPPGDDLGHVQVVGRHEQRHVLDRPADEQVARPPAFRRHVDEPPQIDLLRVVGEALDGEVAFAVEVFRAAFQLERILAQRQLQRDVAGKDEMVGPEGGRRVGPAGPPGFPLWVARTEQVHAAGDRLAACFVHHADGQLLVGGPQRPEQDQENDHRGGRTVSFAHRHPRKEG